SLEQNNFLNIGLTDKKSRAAYVFKHILHLKDEDAADILSVSIEKYLHLAGETDPLFNARFCETIHTLLDKKEIWHNIEYSLSRHFTIGRRFRNTLIATLSIFALIFASFELYYCIKIGRIKKASEQIASVYLSDKDYYKNTAFLASSTLPNMDTKLFNALQTMEDDNLIRVAFRFYDPKIMLQSGLQGETLLSLYTDMYNTGFDRGLVHSLIAKGISQYYANYKTPFLPRFREEDFKSEYENYFISTLDFAKSHGFLELVEKHPNIFESKQSFDDYLKTKLALEEFKPINSLIRLEYDMQSEINLREEYETAIFSFFNSDYTQGNFSPKPFAYTNEELEVFEKKKRQLGDILCQNLFKACAEILKNQSLTQNIYGGDDISLFSADFTKKQLLDIAKSDPRFVFLGTDAPYSPTYPKNIENALTAEILKNKWTKQDIFIIDEKFDPMSVNYLAPLRLPMGFIEQFRSQTNAGNTLFEQITGYGYRIRYAHSKKMLGVFILRDIVKNDTQNYGYCLKKFKPFTRLGEN
ncbi:MAG: hypothetical protein Q4E07_03850, partial [Eubacteriales bacterium]|nr:hypothetical protein [Eubacteriales bacterium]